MKKKELQREADELRRIREALGLTRAEFGAAIGASTSTVANVENGQQRLGMRKFERARALLRECDDAGTTKCPTSSPTSRGFAECRESIPTEEDLIQAVEAARDRETVEAAEALAKVADISLNEALAVIIRKRLEGKK